MNKKQVIGIIVAGLVFTFVCSMSILTSHFTKLLFPQENLLKKTLSDSGKNFDLPGENFIGTVDVQGTIASTSTSSLFETIPYNHQNTLDLIDAFMNSRHNKGILLTVNSPGGGVYESDELYLKLKEYKEKTGRPVWTYMETQACSGGYYISMASDRIIANRNTWTGSIGVIMELLNYKELEDKLGVKSIYFTSGRNKAMGSPSLNMTEEQEEILQSLIDESYEQFVTIVAKGRKMAIDKVKPIADGRIYTAAQALKLNLIDEIDTYDNTVTLFKEKLNSDILYTPSSNSFNFSQLLGAVREMNPKSDTEIMAEFFEKEGSGVPMYYAKPGQY